MSRRGRCENSRRLTFHLPAQPELCRAIDELLHLCSHVAVAGGASKDETVSVAQIVKRTLRNGCLRLIRLIGEPFFCFHVFHIIRKFRHPTEGSVNTNNVAGSFLNGFGHRQNMPVNGVVYNEYLHQSPPCLFGRALRPIPFQVKQKATRAENGEQKVETERKQRLPNSSDRTALLPCILDEQAATHNKVK